MIDEKKSLEMLEGYSAHYNYDVSYMKSMLKEAPSAYETFEGFLPMASYSNKIENDVFFVAQLTAMKNEDCGSCLQLIVDKAIEAGVEKNIIEELMFNEGKNLDDELKDVYEFTLAVVTYEEVDKNLYDKMNWTYSKEIMVELSLAIASCKVFPTLKRVLNNFESCSLIKIKV